MIEAHVSIYDGYDRDTFTVEANGITGIRELLSGLEDELTSILAEHTSRPADVRIRFDITRDAAKLGPTPHKRMTPGLESYLCQG